MTKNNEQSTTNVIQNKPKQSQFEKERTRGLRQAAESVRIWRAFGARPYFWAKGLTADAGNCYITGT